MIHLNESWNSGKCYTYGHSFLIKDTTQEQLSEKTESKDYGGPEQLPCLLLVESGLATWLAHQGVCLPESASQLWCPEFVVVSFHRHDWLHLAPWPCEWTQSPASLLFLEICWCKASNHMFEFSVDQTHPESSLISLVLAQVWSKRLRVNKSTLFTWEIPRI